MARLKYVPEDHTYRLDGVIVPSVTKVLQDAGEIHVDWINQWYLQRGVAVHSCCQYLDDGDLDEASIDPEIKGFVDAYRDFKKHLEPEVLHSEKIVYSKQYGYCGRLDRVVRIKGVTAILDLKTNSMPKHVGLQTAAYQQAAKECGIVTGERLSLLLQKSGQFKLRPLMNPNDLPRFLECLNRVKANEMEAT